MWLKIMGSLLVVAAGTGAGFSMASRYGERQRQIGQVIGCLTALQSYVNYIAMPLPDALRECGAQVDGPVRELLCRTGDALSVSGWLTPRQALIGAMDSIGPRLALGGAERELLLQLAANLGTSDRGEQQRYLAMVLEELGRIDLEARRARDQNAKMYRYLGICGGLAVVLLLV